MRYLFLLSLTLGLILTGCEDQQTDLSDIEAELRQLIQDDEALRIDGLNDNGAVEVEYDEGLELDGGLAKILADTLWPGTDAYRIRFGRQITGMETAVDFDIDQENGVAIANLSRTLTGNFIVVAIDSNHAVVDSFVKPFESVFNRKVRFVRVSGNDSNSDRRHWRVDALTIGVGGTGDKVAISQIQIFSSDSTVADYTFTADEVGDLFIARDSLPTFLAWRPLRVEVTVENAGPEFPYLSGESVMLHYGRDRHHKARRLMFDNGQFGDAVANDNVFTRVWRMHGPGMGFPRRIFGAFVDVIDFGTLYAEEEAVHTAVWALPYRSVRP
jgi:hypothetical protein